MSTRPRRRVTAAIGALGLAVTGLAAVSAPTAQADVIGKVYLTPPTGGSETLMNFETAGPCPEETELVRVMAFGLGFEEGVVLHPSSAITLSKTDPMNLNLTDTWRNLAQEQSTHLAGDYSVRAQCTDGFGMTVYDEYVETVAWTTPGNSVANLAQATYVAPNPPVATVTTVAVEQTSPQLENTPVTLTATIDGGETDPDAGAVEFFDGTTSLGEADVDSGAASLSGVVLPVGQRSLSALFKAEAGFRGSRSNEIPFMISPLPKKATTTTLAVTPNGVQVVGTALTLTATVAVTGEPATQPAVGDVEFFDGATSLGTVAVSAGSAQKTGVQLTAGTHSLTAQYKVATQYEGSTSSAVSVTLNDPAPTTFTKTVDPLVSGSNVVGGTLVANGGAWSPAPTGTSVQWLRNSVAIPGATGASYRLTGADYGTMVRARITVSGPGFTDGVADSASSFVRPGTLTVVKAPGIKGKKAVGKKLKAYASFTPAAKPSYQWLKGTKPIAGATAARYKVKRKDAGKKLRVRVTAKALGYDDAVLTSKAVKITKAKR